MADVKTDSWIGSLIWGRLGAFILIIASMILARKGITLTDADQKAMFDAISVFMGSLGAIYALGSKIREELKKTKTTLGSGGYSCIWLLPFLVVVLFIGFAIPAMAKDFMLSWDRNTDDAVGYKIHIGTASNSYSINEDTGANVQYILRGVPDNAVYYAAVSAYDAFGNESIYSAEVKFDTVPPSAPKGLLARVWDGIVSFFKSMWKALA